MNDDFGRQSMHKGHLLHFEPTRLPNSQYKARLTITSLGGRQTRSQRFVDLDEHYETEAEAAQRARQVGVEWVDSSLAPYLGELDALPRSLRP